MRMTDETKKALLRITTAVGGVLGLVLFMWTPKTGRGVLAYVALFAVLVFIAIALAPKHTGYWPGRHDDR
jgi:uncharacterized membrane protein YccC